MNKRVFIIMVFATFLIGYLNGQAKDLIKNHESRIGKQPNVILIMADDMGIGDLICYGQTNFSIPYTDALPFFL